MGAKKKSLSLFFDLLKSRGFIRPGGPHGPQYGAPGTLMRHHIQKQWWATMVQGQDSVFPVEHTTPLLNNEEAEHALQNGDDSTQLGIGLNSACLAEYPHILKLTNGQLPFSVISITTCRSCQGNNTSSQERDFFLGSKYKKRLLLQNYTPPTGSNKVLDYWLQLRLSWWKRLAKNPARFQVVSGSQVNGGESISQESSPPPSPSGSHLSIVYDFPWGRESVEEVSNLGESLVQSFPEEERKDFKKTSSGKREVLPHCIQCSTCLESAMAALLVDSYHERGSGGGGKRQTKTAPKQVLQLHRGVAPYQVAVVRVPAAASSEYSVQISHVSRKLSSDLQRAGISVFNASHHGGSLLAHYRRNDQLGIPYTVVLNADTLNDGVVSIRSRDTELKESSHLAHTVEKLRKYLTAELQ